MTIARPSYDPPNCNRGIPPPTVPYVCGAHTYTDTYSSEASEVLTDALLYVFPSKRTPSIFARIPPPRECSLFDGGIQGSEHPRHCEQRQTTLQCSKHSRSRSAHKRDGNTGWSYQRTRLAFFWAPHSSSVVRGSGRATAVL